MKIGTVDVDKLRGVGDKFVGLAKETTGVLIGNVRLQKSGEAQQTKATETLKSLRDEMQAETDQKKADSYGSQSDGADLGVLNGAKGKLKETVGSVAGRSDLQKEGQAEQKQGAAEKDAIKNRASAKAHDAKAKAADGAQESADNS